MRNSNSTAVGRRRHSARVVAWLLLLAFTLQCYATQVHIHGAPLTPAGVSAQTLAGETGHHGKTPGTPDPADCPICQAIAHTGLFFTPAAPFLLLPVFVVHIAPLVGRDAIAGTTTTHDWRSRAPPRN